MIKNIICLRFVAVLAVLFLFTSCASSGGSARKSAIMDRATNAYQMGTVYFNDGKYLAALKALTRAVELAPDQSEFHNALALAYGARGLYDLSREHFEKSITLDPMMSEAYVNLSALYLKEKEWEKAIQIAEGALKNVFYKTPEFAYNNIAWGMLNSGDVDGAVKNLTKAVEINSRYKWGFNNLGLALERSGDLKAAENAYENALNIDKKFGAAHLNLGLLLKRRGDNDRALKEFEKTIEVSPGTSWSLSAKRYILELNDSE